MALFEPGRLRVLNLVNSDALAGLDAALDERRWTTWRLDGGEVVDGETLFARAATDLPSPFTVRPTTDYDSFADNLWEACLTSSTDDIAFVWTEAHQMLEGGLGDLLTAVALLRRTSQRLAEIDSSRGGATTLYTFLVGDGPNFPVGARDIA